MSDNNHGPRYDRADVIAELVAFLDECGYDDSRAYDLYVRVIRAANDGPGFDAVHPPER